MQKFINLEQTPFIDLRNKKNSSNFQNIPINQQQIAYKIHNNFTKFDETPYLISNPQHQKIINDLISTARQQMRVGIETLVSKKFKQLSIKHADLVVKYLKQGNPQAAFVAKKAQAYDQRYNFPIEKMRQIAKKTSYPLLLSISLLSLIQSQNKKQRLMGLEFLDKTIKAGLPEGFIWKGLYQTYQGDGIKAYQMFKNAQKLGYEPIAYKYLGQLFTGRNPMIKSNLKLAEKYFKKAKECGVYIQPSIYLQIKQIQIEKQKQRIKFNSIKSTEDTQSVQLQNFISNKIKEFKHSNNFKNRVSLGNVFNTTNPQSIASFNDPITFYVVFSPLMGFPGRHFLAKDINGSLEYISIYNWDQMPIEKLQLLHQVGTKIILNDYIRKIGSGDNLPIFRVDNPFTVQIYKRTQRHTISDKQFRNFAKNLFQRNLLEKAMNIYQYMIMKESQEMQIIFSNMGLICQRQKNISEAIKYYEKSLEIKKFSKSQIRLANIHIKNGNLEKAQLLIKQIQSPSQRQELLKQIKKIKEKESDASDFTKQIKNKHRLKKQLFNISEDPFFKLVGSNPSCMINIREDRYHLLFYKSKFQQALNVKVFLSQQKFLDLLQSIYNAVQSKNLTKQIVQNFYKMTEVAFYTYFSNQKLPYSASYLAVITPYAIDFRKQIRAQVNTVQYMGNRQNYLQNRIQDLCLGLQEKGKYKQAEELYRFTGNYCTPFNVKVAEMLFMQEQYEKCQEYCTIEIKRLSQYSFKKFFKYLSQLIVWQLKSLIRLHKYETVIMKGQQCIKQFKQKCPQLTYEDQSFRKGIFKFKVKSKEPEFEQTKQLLSANILIQRIYKQIVRAFISAKHVAKAREYFAKVSLKKQNCNFSQMIQQYYQSRLLELLIIRMEDPFKAIKQTDSILKEINKDKKIQNKLPYTKFLIKQKLSLLIETQKIPQVIKQSQEIIKNKFTKDQKFSFKKQLSLKKKKKKLKMLSIYCKNSTLMKNLKTSRINRNNKAFNYHNLLLFILKIKMKKKRTFKIRFSKNNMQIKSVVFKVKIM